MKVELVVMLSSGSQMISGLQWPNVASGWWPALTLLSGQPHWLQSPHHITANTQ